MLAEDNLLRRVIFRPYAKGKGPAFTLTTWDTGRVDDSHFGKHILGYRLRVGKITLFEGEDFHCSPQHAADSDQAVESVMGFLTLKPGDTDREFFKGYTPAQLEYCKQHAESLGLEVMARFGGGN